MRAADLYRQRQSQKPVISFELSRPKDDKASASLDKALVALKAAEPDYVSVTFGAGGSTRAGCFELVDKLKRLHGFGVVAYVAGVGLGPDDLATITDRFVDLGVETLFVVRGDAPKDDATFEPHSEAMAHASDMLAFVRAHTGASVCLGAAGYPEGHVEASSLKKDVEFVKLKVDRGAEYIVAQYFYDNQYFYDFVEHCEAANVSVPIVPGIMPIYSVKMMEILAGICGVTITDTVRRGLAELSPDDKKAVSQFGIDFAAEQCRKLIEHGVPGLHFYTMNRSKAVTAILSTLRAEGLL